MTDRLSLGLAILGALAMVFLLVRVCFSATGIELAVAQAIHASTSPPLPAWRDVLARLIFRAMSGQWLSPDELVLMRTVHPAWVPEGDPAGVPLRATHPDDDESVRPPSLALLTYLSRETAYLHALLGMQHKAGAGPRVDYDGLRASSNRAWGRLSTRELADAATLLAPYRQHLGAFLADLAPIAHPSVDLDGDEEGSLRTPIPSPPSEDVQPVETSARGDA